MRISAVVAVTVLGVVSFTACGSDSDGGGESGSAGNFCDKIQEIDDSNVDPDTDPAAAVKILKDLASSAPSEIRDDFEAFAGALEAATTGDAGALAELDIDEMTQSIAAIGAYIGENCEGVNADVFNN